MLLIRLPDRPKRCHRNAGCPAWTGGKRNAGTKGSDLEGFAWQNGYGIFSIGFSQIEAAQNYVAGQEEHHRKISFQDEFRRLLRRYGMEFDERYVWD